MLKIPKEPIQVSVLLCAYNAEQTIADAIESVLSQEFEAFELIIINDGSKDSTLSIAENYAKKDNRIRVFSQSNSGIGISRNNAIEKASGNYLAFIDSDDIWHPAKLKIQSQVLTKKQGITAIICDTYEFERTQELKGFFRAASDENVYFDEYKNLGELLLLKNFDFSPASVIWNAVDLKAIGGYGKDRNGEDFKPFLRMAVSGRTIYRIHSKLYARRCSINSLSRSSTNHYLGALARVREIESIQENAFHKQTAQVQIGDATLELAKQRFLRWAISGIRTEYPKTEYFRRAFPLIKKLNSKKVQFIEVGKTIIFLFKLK